MGETEHLPLITVSFPVFEGDNYIEASLHSVLCQDYPNIELLIIDDKGKTKAFEIAESIIKDTKQQVKIIRNSVNLGQGFVRNKSIELAKGDYIFFMDSDDILSPDCISLLVDTILAYNVDFVGASSVNLEHEIISDHFIYPEFKVIKDTPLTESIYLDGISISPYMWNKLYNVNLLKENDIKCTHPYMEDFHFSFLLFNIATSCVLLPNITYKYVLHDTSISRTSFGKNLSQKTADIAMEIVLSEYAILDKMTNQVIKEKALLEIIGFGIMYVFKIKVSSTLSALYKNYAKKILTYPRLNVSEYTHFSKYEKNKHIYYRVLQILPFQFKLVLIRLFNFPHYRKRVYM
ncbi:glycosyltransferase family 2 protein [Saccharicrinis sp. FJH62]|uniref:glycosyltransferase family 2 protein n=1 Tax=Saccharicrinis sp. FJH62 TaxID=3344657 RepID=UPI0035D40AB7